MGRFVFLWKGGSTAQGCISVELRWQLGLKALMISFFLRLQKPLNLKSVMRVMDMVAYC